MAGHHHAASEVIQKLLQHVEGLDVQIVGRLVEQQDVGPIDERAQQVEPPPLAVAEGADIGLLLGPRKQEPLQHQGRIHEMQIALVLLRRNIVRGSLLMGMKASGMPERRPKC